MEALAVVAVPFAGWGVLGVIAHVEKINLRVTLPWLRALPPAGLAHWHAARRRCGCVA
jgi:hypothetical protein